VQTLRPYPYSWLVIGPPDRKRILPLNVFINRKHIAGIAIWDTSRSWLSPRIMTVLHAFKHNAWVSIFCCIVFLALSGGVARSIEMPPPEELDTKNPLNPLKKYVELHLGNNKEHRIFRTRFSYPGLRGEMLMCGGSYEVFYIETEKCKFEKYCPTILSCRIPPGEQISDKILSAVARKEFFLTEVPYVFDGTQIEVPSVVLTLPKGDVNVILGPYGFWVNFD
jgi:hypothetical protein